MKCKCGSEKLRAVGDSLDYIFYQVEGNWVISNPELKYFHSTQRPYQIYCYDCHHHFSVDKLDKVSSATINHKEITLDLDHTLFFVDYGREAEGYDFKFNDPEGGYTYYAYKRPHLDHFISELSKRFDQINFFTAATDWYAKELINTLKISKDKLGYIKSRADTVRGRPLSFEWELIKNMENSLMVEDRPLVVEGYNNIVFKVEAFYLNKEDKALLKVLSFLNQKGQVTETPEKVSGVIEVFLRHLQFEVKSLPFSLIREILDLPTRTQEEIDKGPVRTQVFKSYVQIVEKDLFIRIVDLNYPEYLSLVEKIKPFSKVRKISAKKYNAILEDRYSKSRKSNNF